MAVIADMRLDAPREIPGQPRAIHVVPRSNARPVTHGIPEQLIALGGTAPQRIAPTVRPGMSQVTAR